MSNLLVIFIGAAAFLATTNSQRDFHRALWGDSYLKVKTSNGYVQGSLGKTCRTEKHFVGFRGIPYAEPPVGRLRFRDPVPKENWDGVWNATYQRHFCTQGSLDDAPIMEENYSEDCLYLNVYTPNMYYLKLGLGSPKAVMVFIHPGAFTTGSSSEKIFSPDFLIDQDVVVVTFNYRLGALGFLSLQNEDVPGNAGLKDQNLVLRWVKENIKHFGGDPSRITIFGQSAGAASVNFHILSTSSAGLFRSAIMQSGASVASWAYSPPELALKKAINLSKKVGCRSKVLKEVLECLQRVPAQTISKHQQKALTVEELFSLRIIAFQPTAEPNVPGAFLTGNPLVLMNSGNFTKVPVIIGSTLDESLYFYPPLIKKDQNGLLITLLGMDLSRFTPYDFQLKPFSKAAIMAHQHISRFYFNSKAVTKALMNNILELLTDVLFIVPIQYTASLFADISVPVYNYLFTYEGRYNFGKAELNITEVPGASHGDDLGYLFYAPPVHRMCARNISRHSPDELMIDRMTKMWTNFAKNGNDPTPSIDSLIQWRWNRFTSHERNYLDLGKLVVPSDSIKLANVAFWENLIQKLIEVNKSNTQGEAIDNLELSNLNF